MRNSETYRSLVPAALAVVAAVLVLSAGTPDPDRGQEVFDTVCATCHTLTPPPGKAPPMLMIAGHYVQASDDEATARKAMRAWVPAPDTARSLLPNHAVERFGLMAPLALPKSDVNAVVEYIFGAWKDAETPTPQGPRCEGAMCGQGMPHRGGMSMGDSTDAGGMRMCASGMCARRAAPADSTMSTGMGMQHRMHQQMQNDGAGTGMQHRMHRQMQNDGAGMGMQDGTGCACSRCRHGSGN